MRTRMLCCAAAALLLFGVGMPAEAVKADTQTQAVQEVAERELDLSKVKITPASQTGYLQEGTSGPLLSAIPEYHFTLKSTELLSESDPDVDVWYESSNEAIEVKGSLVDNEITIRPDKVGKTVVTITVNEKEFRVKINTIAVRMPNSLLLATKETKKYSVKGDADAKWSSSDPSVVRVASDGTLYAKKTGNAVIRLRIGSYRLGCAVSVTTPERKKAVEKASTIGHTCTYSQLKRMQEHYYDCSSLVWKAYHNYGVNFGSRYNAPVAADIGKWCVLNNKIVSGGFSEENVQKMRLQAGDLLFKTGAQNGRYKGIYHVEMITGYTLYGFDEDGEPMIGIRWGTDDDKYYPIGQMVGRP